MLRLYCLPGRVFAELAYLFPASGTVWASARRRESRIAHFIFSTLFYGGAVMLLLSIVNPKVRGKADEVSSASAAIPMTQDIRPPLEQPIVNQGRHAAPAELDQVIIQDSNSAVPFGRVGGLVSTNRDLEPPFADEVRAPVNKVTDTSFTPAEEELINNPRQSEAVKAAIQAAYATNSRQKWEDGRLSGWAVPSTSNTGCTLVSYTIDQISNDRQPANPAAICN